MINKLTTRALYLALLSFGLSAASTVLLTNLSSFFKFLGASDSSLPFLWLIPPVTGLVMQPIIGEISDNTSTRFGKRRPFIFIFGIIAAASLLIFTQAQSVLFAVFIILLMDCSINGCTESLRALTGDGTKTSDERTKAFALQGFFAGIGGSVGAILPYISEKVLVMFHRNHPVSAYELPLNLKYSLLIVTGILLATLYASIYGVKEKSSRKNFVLKQKKSSKKSNNFNKMAKDLWNNVVHMPAVFKNIFYINSLTWIGIFTFWLYFTISLAQKYGLTPGVDTTTAESVAILQRATLDTSFYFGIYQYVSIAYALFLYFISKSERVDTIHACSLLVGGVALASLGIAKTHYALMSAFVGIGIMWGSILVLPYVIVTRILPKKKIGVYLGIFNMSITIPQIICGFALTPTYVYLCHENASWLMFVSGIIIVASCWGWFNLSKKVASINVRKEYKLFITSEKAG